VIVPVIILMIAVPMMAVAAFLDWLGNRFNRIDAKLDKIIDREKL
jgi:hypothetical protein